MENITYEGETPRTVYVPAPPKGIIGFLIRHKIAKDAQSANVILLVVAIFCAVSSLIILWPTIWSALGPAPNFENLPG